MTASCFRWTLCCLTIFALSMASDTLNAPAQAADTQKPGGTKEINFDDIKLELKKDEPYKKSVHLTDKVEKLDGQHIRIRGWILPGYQASGIKQFVLVRDNKECCFGPGAALYDCILVDMEEGKSTSFTTRPVAVEGTFTLSEFKGPDGRQLAIYHLVGEKVK